LGGRNYELPPDELVAQRSELTVLLGQSPAKQLGTKAAARCRSTQELREFLNQFFRATDEPSKQQLLELQR
jgi:hypothetical protein